MTLPTSGSLSLAQIKAEFSAINSNILSAYRGARWYKDDNTRGYFPSGASTTAISMSLFYGTRSSITVTPSGPTSISSGSYTVPFYNKITFVIKGGDGGQKGPNGWNGEGNYPTPGSDGGGGNSSYLYGYVTAGGGGGNGGTGSTATVVFDADAQTVTINGSVQSSITPPTRNSIITYGIGSGGSGGRGGYNRVYRDFPYPYDYLDGWYNEDNGNYGANGASGYVTVKVE
jgi:hypothetical protein